MSRLRKLAAEARKMTPVFIVGEARSGTSILYHVLQRHPSFRPKEVSLHETRLLTQLPLAFLFRGCKPRRLWRYMLEDDHAYGEFLRAIRPARIPLALLVLPNLVRPRSTGLVWRLSLAPAVLRSYIVLAGRARGAMRLVDKSPTTVTQARKLVHGFPNARLLYVYRDPVQVLSSYRKRYERDPKARWASIDLDTFCKVWRRNTAAALELAADEPARFLLIRYEGFTSAPEDEFRRICVFLDEEFAPEALAVEFPDLDRWTPDPHLFGPIVTETKRWQDFVSEDEAVAIRSELGPLIDRLGLLDSAARYPDRPASDAATPRSAAVHPRR